MKKIALLAFAVVALVGFNATILKANEYVINDLAVENLFASVEETQVSLELNAFSNTLIPQDKQMTMGSKNPWVAFALSLAFFIVPIGGIHRFYLGTKTLTGVGYIITLGGCGIVQFVDAVLLLIGAIENDISKYEDNPKFFMW
jgi:TM2 domain-containing membrane protein YozV